MVFNSLWINKKSVTDWAHSFVRCKSADERLCFSRSYVDELTTVFAFREDYCAINKSVKSVVFTHTNVFTWVVNCATLTFDNVTSFSKLTAENLNTESFAF